jgi:hypothetical protein
VKLTEHFTREEITRSQVATRQSIANDPNDRQWVILKEGALHILEPSRVLMGGPLQVSSGFRCTALNSMIGGARKSDHMVEGRNCAFDLVHQDLGRLFRMVYVELPWSKLIWEYGAWVHISYCADGPPENRRPMSKLAGQDYQILKFNQITKLGRVA